MKKKSITYIIIVLTIIIGGTIYIKNNVRNNKINTSYEG